PRVGIGDVARQPLRPSLLALALGQRLVEVLGSASDQEHGGALGTEPAGGRAGDPAAPPRDGARPAIEPEVHQPVSIRSWIATPSFSARWTGHLPAITSSRSRCSSSS